MTRAEHGARRPPVTAAGRSPPVPPRLGGPWTCPPADVGAPPSGPTPRGPEPRGRDMEPFILPFAPEDLYRHVADRPGDPLPAPLDEAYVLLAGPGAAPASPPGAGDLLVRIAVGGAEVAEVTADDLQENDFARRVLDGDGRVPDGLALLRPRAGTDGNGDGGGASRDRTPVTVDADAAVPPFATAVRAAITAALLTPKQSAAAITWTTTNHDARSGVLPSEIATALDSYVDAAATHLAIQTFNAANPTAPVALGSGAVDAVLVERIHQFQRKVFADPAQHDGFAGQATLDALGLIARGGSFHDANQSNAAAQDVLNAHAAQVSSLS